jgi:SAM-dependent methyltransferase
MTGLVGVVTQEPGFVGLVAALAVLIFLATSFVLLVVAVGDEGGARRAADEEDLVEDQHPIVHAPAAEAPVASVASVITERRVAPVVPQVVDHYATGMASSLRDIAAKVVERAWPRGGERILDGATGAIIPTSAALLAGRWQIDVDVDRGTLAIGRREVGADTAGAEFAVLPFAPGWFQVIVSVHSLQFAANPVGVLAEWRRVASSGARLSLSLPGPRAAVGMNKYDHIYRRHGAGPQVHLPTRRALTAWATAAGWQEVQTFAAAETVIGLSGPDAFQTWLRTRPWSDPDQALSSELMDALGRDLLAVIPTGANGQLRIPFGTLYLTARSP